MEVTASRAMPGHGWVLAACLLLLMGLFAALVSATQLRPGETRPVEVAPSSDGVVELRLKALPGFRFKGQ